MEVIVPARLLFDTAKLARAVENAGRGAAAGMQVDFDVTTRTWKHRPKFIVRRPRPGEWEIYTIDKIYGIVSSGSPPHKIAAKSGGRLAFNKTGFRPKSRPRYIGSNKGRQADKDFRRPAAVNHPGHTAREFPEAIVKKWEKQLPSIFQRAIDSEV
jgi:hypothetical protein